MATNLGSLQVTVVGFLPLVTGLPIWLYEARF